MKFSFVSPPLTVVALLAAALHFPPAQAATLIWDTDAGTAGAQDGAGTWDNAALNWNNAGSNVAILPYVQVPLSAAHVSGTNTITVSPANAALLKVGQAFSRTEFAAGTTITLIDTTTGVVTLSGNSTGAITNGSVIGFAANDSVVFGSGNGAAGAVTVLGNQGANAMTINAAGSGNYSFAGGSITLGSNNGSTGTLTVNDNATITSAFNWKNITFATTGKTVTLSGGSTAGNVVGAFNGNVGGSTAAIAENSTLAVTAGAYTTGGAGNTINIGNLTTGTGGLQFSGGSIAVGGNFQIGNAGRGFVNHSGGTLTSTGQITAGRAGVGNVGRYVLSGGTINSTSSSTAPFALGRAGGVGTFDMNSGALNIVGSGTGNATTAVGGVMLLSMADNTGTGGGTATFNLNGGTVTVKEIRLNSANNTNEGTASSGSATLNVNGGTLYLGGNVTRGASGSYTTSAGGLRNYGTGTSTFAVNLTGGTVGATADWSSNVNMTLSNTNGGVTFRAADVASVARNITLTSTLVGAGGFTKTGGGLLTLSGANTFTGNSIIDEGGFTLDTAGSLLFQIGAGGVNNFMDNNSVSNVNLLGSFVFDLTSAATAPGLQWNIVLGGATYGDRFTVQGWTDAGAGLWTNLNYTFNESTGVLSTTVVPEPARALLLFGALFVMIVRRRR